MLNQGENENHCKFYPNYSKPLDKIKKKKDMYWPEELILVLLTRLR